MKNDVLFAAAVDMEPHLETLSMRQFNARYPLRVRRWELSERTRILQPSGPLSRAAAANPAAPVSPRPQPLLAVATETDGSAIPAQDLVPSSEPQPAAVPQPPASVTTTPETEAASPQARIAAPRPTVTPLAPAKPRATAPAPSQMLVPHLETRPRAPDESVGPEPDMMPPAPIEQAPARAVRRRRRTSHEHDEGARAEVIMVMLRWATAIGQASAIPEVFATLSTVDDYVDRIANVLDIP